MKLLKTMTKMKKIEETLLQVALRIAKRGEGALFVVGNNIKYEPLVDQTVPPFHISKNPKLLESLALMDGAILIDKKGFLKAYGIMIKTKKSLKNFGTRHQAGMAAAAKGNIVYLVSEEDRKIKIMREGKVAMQIDPFERNVEKNVPVISEWLESLGAGTLGSIGAAALVPTLGLTFLPGVIIFGSAYYISKILTNSFSKRSPTKRWKW